MNKKIKELAEQVYGMDTHYDDGVFAELIIKECISCISTEIDRLTKYQNSLEESEDSKRNDVDLCVEKCYDNIEMLKNHFGLN